MKKTNITIPFEEEKLLALRLFTGKKDADIDSELEDAIQKLYEKYVPKDARELVEMMVAGTDAPKGKTAKKAPAAKNTPANDTATSASNKPPTAPGGSSAAGGSAANA